MQNNVTELTQKLLRSLDSNYNVIDLPTVIEVISLLEKVSITKELLETTRLGRHVNELRRKTTNDSLSRRAKELVKKWRSMVLPESNGQLKAATLAEAEDVNLNKTKKRPIKDSSIDNVQVKRAKLNGIADMDFSDNSNSSFKDVINSNIILKTEPKRDVILINSDSNSSVPEAAVAVLGSRTDPPVDQQMPKKRGRKKGSKNHKNLIDEAETSFTNKLAVSRGNSKVKTTQELIASLQNKTTNSMLGLPNAKIKEDLNERAAKLTERVSIIDQKLNTNRMKLAQRNKNRLMHSERNERILESGSVINDKSLLSGNNSEEEEDIIVVCEDSMRNDVKDEPHESQETDDTNLNKSSDDGGNVISSLSIEEALAQLPPIDRSFLYVDETAEPKCTCFLKEKKPDFDGGEEEEENDLDGGIEFVEDQECPARINNEEKYRLHEITDEKVRLLHDSCMSSVNGNRGLGVEIKEPEMLPNGLYENVVPNVNNECVKRDVMIGDFSGENFKKYSISECFEGKHEVDGDLLMNNFTNKRTDVVVDNNDDEDDKKSNDLISNSNYSFREWHQVTETPSYNGEILKILPYVIID